MNCAPLCTCTIRPYIITTHTHTHSPLPPPHAPQFSRMAVLESFRQGQAHVLVATDVAARGLDIQLCAVVNYDAARDMDTHVHRWAGVCVCVCGGGGGGGGGGKAQLLGMDVLVVAL